MLSLFEQIGGREAVQAAVDLFYQKVIADPRINFFFANIDMKEQRRKQVMFMTYALGGQINYSGKDMRQGHQHLVRQGLNDKHFDAVLENLAQTLSELNIPPRLIAQAAAIVESTRSDVLNKKKPAELTPE